MRWIAFDVETPNFKNDRMSSIGIAIVENGAVVDTFSSLVDPETHFDRFNVELTGITPEAVQGAPTFAALWPRIEPLMSSGILVAHNAVFDLGVLKKCLAAYGIEWKPSVRYLCTVQTGRKLLPDMGHSLNVMCDFYGIALDHHKADSDARACAEILLRYAELGAELGSFIRTYRLV